MRLLLRQGPDRYWEIYNHRMPGVEVVIGPACTCCGECVPSCYGGDRVIPILESRVKISDRCIGCGRCVLACPEGAISLRIDPSFDLTRELLHNISRHTRIGNNAEINLSGD